ncbi:hypothetical protein M427DRAFT_152968 [Gonapodya prolifera JEL478]|uniref:Uncharacterized protein n=1 Tax=Gonapodya prolifera (strain JEL478) TaxID=1344416 RepID=A0A139AQL0_GONPJ|nr:hypothetical protein M427DRAFT_152968 [Gonapodya prolifera JEL478]|eukprot:KXS19051.1 hypothetical protein M427DRAFT_152968 [Gonapodya prolifera JEL478]
MQPGPRPAAVAAGASPHARKSVTTKGRYTSSRRFIKANEYAYWEDTKVTESALCLAIRGGDVVDELLIAGADPNERISWAVPNAFEYVQLLKSQWAAQTGRNGTPGSTEGLPVLKGDAAMFKGTAGSAPTGPGTCGRLGAGATRTRTCLRWSTP